MEESFWHNKWEIGQIGFHEKQANPLLIKFLEKLQLNPNQENGSRIFLPLCGKTLDIHYLLGLGYQIVGVEFSELAIKELFQELDITPTVSKIDNFIHYQAPNIDIYVGDFFDLHHKLLGKFDAIYDRASLIALPEDIRLRYKQQLCKLTNCVKQLLICIEYDQSLMNGPPFSITAEMVNQYYDANYSVECLERNKIAGGFKGKYEGYESVYSLTPKI
ncbi:UNVERIFIED_CONTAM: hypothetical protein GTU68_001047 [Idotea baltica]|nr:hypothetical protein [Idotea baltica]